MYLHEWKESVCARMKEWQCHCSRGRRACIHLCWLSDPQSGIQLSQTLSMWSCSWWSVLKMNTASGCRPNGLEESSSMILLLPRVWMGFLSVWPRNVWGISIFQVPVQIEIASSNSGSWILVGLDYMCDHHTVELIAMCMLWHMSCFLTVLYKIAALCRINSLWWSQTLISKTTLPSQDEGIVGLFGHVRPKLYQG